MSSKRRSSTASSRKETSKPRKEAPLTVTLYLSDSLIPGLTMKLDVIRELRVSRDVRMHDGNVQCLMTAREPRMPKVQSDLEPDDNKFLDRSLKAMDTLAEKFKNIKISGERMVQFYAEPLPAVRSHDTDAKGLKHYNPAAVQFSEGNTIHEQHYLNDQKYEVVHSNSLTAIWHGQQAIYHLVISRQIGIIPQDRKFALDALPEYITGWYGRRPKSPSPRKPSPSNEDEADESDKSDEVKEDSGPDKSATNLVRMSDSPEKQGMDSGKVIRPGRFGPIPSPMLPSGPRDFSSYKPNQRQRWVDDRDNRPPISRSRSRTPTKRRQPSPSQSP